MGMGYERNGATPAWRDMGTLYTILVLASAVTMVAVNRRVPQPYIDELFHLRQCQAYCRGHFDQWDDKITTPPGLYLLGLAYARALAAVPLETCGTAVLRLLNALGGVVVLPLVLRAFGRPANFTAANVAALPLLYTFYFLFYTDVWATVLVVAALAWARVAPPHAPVAYAWASALTGFASLWLRQTNILWVAWIAVVFVEARTKGGLLAVLRRAPRDWAGLAAFAAVGASFVAFVVRNGGITLGDKQNHAFSLHLVQAFYCWTFVTVLTVPVWLTRAHLRHYVRANLGSWTRAAATVAALAAIKAVVERFTVVHPFLLADNRHFTFYLYRRVLAVPGSWVLAVPAYHFSTWTAWVTVSPGGGGALGLGPLLKLALFVVTAATVAPSPLFEPRYYILPLVLWRLHAQPRHLARLEFAWLMAINAATTAIFLGYEFAWDLETSPQRITW